jgi:hypothetical protein
MILENHKQRGKNRVRKKGKKSDSESVEFNMKQVSLFEMMTIYSFMR